MGSSGNVSPGESCTLPLGEQSGPAWPRPSVPGRLICRGLTRSGCVSGFPEYTNHSWTGGQLAPSEERQRISRCMRAKRPQTQLCQGPFQAEVVLPPIWSLVSPTLPSIRHSPPLSSGGGRERAPGPSACSSVSQATGQVAAQTLCAPCHKR